MKRFRHYDKDTAIVLACFGSVVEQPRYLALQAQVQEQFPDCPVHISFSSRMVLKKLAKQGQDYQNLPQKLAELDMAGYRRIAIAPVYLYPTEEYAMTEATVRGFAEFSLSRMAVTPTLLHKANHATHILNAMHQRFPATDNCANLYIIHGAPLLDNPGYSAIKYSEGLFNRLDHRNFTCSLEGAYPFNVIQNELIRSIQRECPEADTIRLIPLLLVSGNHFINDLHDISDALTPHFKVELATPIKGESFCMLDMPEVTDTLIKQLDETIKKFG